jgi:dienelactone hydrolase
MSEQVSARLKAKRFKPAVRLLEFEDAGHGCFGPPADPTSPNYPNLGSLGGSPDGNNTARKQDWPASIAFLDAALKH